MLFICCRNSILKTNGRILLQVHLIEGIIDQVEGTVHVSWVQPRVLGIPQIKSLRDRLDNWLKKVNTALKSIEAETPDLVASWFFFFSWFASAHCNNSLTEKGKKIAKATKKIKNKKKRVKRETSWVAWAEGSVVFFLSYCLFFLNPLAERRSLLYFMKSSVPWWHP